MCCLCQKPFLNANSNKCFCFLGDLPEPPFPSPPFPGSKVVHRRKKRQVWLHCRNIFCKIIVINRGVLMYSSWLHFALCTRACMFVWSPPRVSWVCECKIERIMLWLLFVQTRLHCLSPVSFVLIHKAKERALFCHSPPTQQLSSPLSSSSFSSSSSPPSSLLFH